eukprot:CAMPEP_0198197624 /NCGR_PEP_ID=MMETSP1445-20131203/1193_1 /TAXON_ID=36898 /ORGANISM="Pyramimonas sp., Strain CCMP2087" /LENGTH=95 /DNA_ID=CAMNT_0043866955 /DNA_START=258 /DNA_END=545 /DNA_ORIENTATION=+
MCSNQYANARSTVEEPLEVSLASSEMALRHKKSREEFSSTIWRPGDTDIVTQQIAIQIQERAVCKVERGQVSARERFNSGLRLGQRQNWGLAVPK